MSDQETAFIEKLTDEFEFFKQDIDRRYSRMQGFLLTVCGILLSAGLIVGFTHFTRDGATRTKVAEIERRQGIVLENAVTQKAIIDIITTFDNQTKVMEEFLPQDIKGAVTEFNKVSKNFRSQILMFQTGIDVRGTTVGERVNEDGSK